MPNLLRLLFRPETRRPTPPPAEVNLRRVVLIGLALWTLASVVMIALAIIDRVDWIAVAVCGAGLALGGIGWLWVKRRATQV